MPRKYEDPDLRRGKRDSINVHFVAEKTPLCTWKYVYYLPQGHLPDAAFAEKMATRKFMNRYVEQTERTTAQADS